MTSDNMSENTTRGTPPPSNHMSARMAYVMCEAFQCTPNSSHFQFCYVLYSAFSFDISRHQIIKYYLTHYSRLCFRMGTPSLTK